MADKQLPFIDIAVHPAVRDRFAAGQAVVLFDVAMERVLWSNGEGARLFGNGLIYDLIEDGPDRADVAFRQLAATAGQLPAAGDKRGVVIRIASGFSRIAIQAEVERIAIVGREDAILLSAPPVTSSSRSRAHIAASLLSGFDDPDTHMAVIDGEGQVLAASPDFARTGLTPDMLRPLVAAVKRSPDRLVKRPILTGLGYLPAAFGMLSDEPETHLMFCVETVLGRMDPPEATAPETPFVAIEVPVSPAPEASEEASDEAVDAPVDEPLEVMFAAPEEALTDLIDEDEGLSAEVIDGEEDLPVVPSEATPDATLEAEPDVLAQSEAETIAVAPDETALQPEAAKAEVNAEPAMVAEPAPEAAVLQEAAPEEPFRFNPAGRPVRFVWKIDTNGIFSEVSEEFARTVGPHAAAVTGIAFSDLAALFNLDADGKITELLGRRDTWSGRTIHWPVEGTSMAVPIDLAALPTYSRNREFDGFRGFGIIRVSDVRPDPLAMGLTLAVTPPDAITRPAPVVAAEQPAEPVEVVEGALPEVEANDHEDEIELTVDDQFRDLDNPDRDDHADFRGETPALKFTPNSGRRLSDKIIQLEERRARRGDGLTTGEQAAFREIARQLEPFGKRPNEKLLSEQDRIENEDDQAEELQDDLVTGDQAPLTNSTDSEQVAETEADLETVTEEPADVPEAASNAEETEADLDELRTGDQALIVDDQDSSDETMTDVPALPVLPRRSSGDAVTAGLIDQLPVALLVHAGDRLIHANPEFFRLTGYDSLDALADEGGLDGLITRMEADDTASQGAVFLVRRDESVVPVTARLQSVRFEDQTALLLAINPIAGAAPSVAAAPEAPVVTAPEEDDVEEAAALRVEVEELRAILETATDGVVLVTAEGEIRGLNRSASALFNYDNAETTGKPFAMLFAHESQKAVMDYLAGLAGHGVASVLNDGREVIGREAQGGFIPLFMTMGKLSSGGYCAVIRDITQWKRSEEELKAAKRAAETANAHKSEFLARVSHEIRTPLNAIIGFSDMMSSERFGPLGHQRYVEYANDIGRSGRHVLDIVNDLLDISKIEAGEMELDFAAVTLNDCISEAVAIIQPQANSQRVIIRTSLSQSVPQVVADLRSVKQIALNILANAVRYTPSGGQVVVSTAYEPNGSVSIRIRDTGIGMSRAELEQAMKPFRQVTTGSRKRGDGTGLGLPLTKAMVEANRAIFSISSQPNDGTLVEITFPSQRVLAD